MADYPPLSFFNDHPDLAFLIMADQIASDYLDFIKQKIVPHLELFDGRSLRELRVLMVIHVSAKPLTSRNIAQILRYDPATVFRAVKQLLNMELIDETPDKNDQRAIRLSMNEKGEEICRTYINLTQKAFSQVSPALGAINPREPYMITTTLIKLRDRTRRAGKVDFDPDEENS